MQANASSLSSMGLRALSLGLALLAAAHFLRWNAPGQAAACATLGLAAALAPRLLPRPLALLLFAAGGIFWAHLGMELAFMRAAQHLPWLRLILIMGGVSLAFAAAAVTTARTRAGDIFGPLDGPAWTKTLAVLLVWGTLRVAQAKAPMPLLLGERFLPGSAPWWEIAFGLYAAWVTGGLLGPRGSTLRARIWALFSLVFFGQLFLGLAGWGIFLMTGDLHLPIPALILAGPLYRGHGIFMLLLFGASLLLVGPAWCSHLCYIGAWDHTMARLGPQRPRKLPAWASKVRTGILALTILVPAALRASGASTGIALLGAGLFGVGGVAVMVLASRRLGTMVHCTLWCPMGLVANLMGRLLPWRLRITAACTRCGRCLPTCRYSALSIQDLKKGRPALTCSLCGDCVRACPHGAMEYAYLGLAPKTARLVFTCLAASLHAVFLAVARI
ncbi:MAG: hypothetical protein PWQ64_305 [Desulfomicrobiaceae bacterium]|jgi:ferredoxin|nr:hypothetical protein [Desulfomicrobiaceae bacterium]MDK2872541.1 hypothetical protein [Desulfomicrobiaceae bacterium]